MLSRILAHAASSLQGMRKSGGVEDAHGRCSRAFISFPYRGECFS